MKVCKDEKKRGEKQMEKNFMSSKEKNITV